MSIHLRDCIVHLALVLLALHDFSRGFDEIFLHNVVSIIADGLHACFCNDVSQIGRIGSVSKLHNGLVISAAEIQLATKIGNQE